MTRHQPEYRRALAVVGCVALLGMSACDERAGDGGPTSPGPATSPSVPASPNPDQPPVVWVDGAVSDVSDESVTVIEDSGAIVELRRLAGSASSFFRREGSEFRRLGDGEIATIEVGEPVCAESLLDGANYLALRVYVGAGCGPA